MAVSTTDTFSGPYLPNGVTVTFPFSFKAVSAGDVAVILRDASGGETVVAEAAYSVTLSSEGGFVSFAVAPIANVGELFVVSEPSFLQSVEFASGQPFLPSVVNNVNDRDVARALYLKDRIDRSFTVPRGESAGTLPPLAQRAGMLAVFSEDGGLAAVPSNWNSTDGFDDGLWNPTSPITDDGAWG